MSKARFTTYFQQRLRDEIESLAEEWLPDEDVLVTEEVKPPGCDWPGQPDIAIYRHGESIKRVVVLEIEHVSSATQAERNVEHVVEWVKADRGRRAAVLHLISVDSALSEGQCDDVMEVGCNARNELRRFSYEFRTYEAWDRRRTREIAKEVAESRDFRVALWRLMNFAGIVP